jgi:hypothetical protein
VREFFEETSKSIQYASSKNVDHVLALYLQKYPNYERKVLHNIVYDYIITQSNKFITIHFEKSELTLNANLPREYSLDMVIKDGRALGTVYSIGYEQRKEEIEKKKKNINNKAAYDAKHPVYKRRIVFTDFYITYTNFDYHLREINSLNESKEIKKINETKKKTNEQHLIDSLQRKTFENI